MPYVRLTDAAVQDLERLRKRDPQIVREVLKKMLLLERSTGVGEPLLGDLIGFRKLVVGNRRYRIVWRETVDETHTPVLEIAEVWAAGARADSEVYEEMSHRVEVMKASGDPKVKALADVIAALGRSLSSANAREEPSSSETLPGWLVEAVRANLRLREAEIENLTQADAQRLLAEHWVKPD